MNTRLPLLALIIFCSCEPLAALASNEEGCAILARGCLARTDTKRDLCLSNLTEAPVCVGSRLSQLMALRTELAPNTSGEDEGPAFLGPRVSNRSCLEQFDARWAAALEKPPLTEKTLEQLTSTLQRCGEEAPTFLFQP